MTLTHKKPAPRPGAVLLGSVASLVGVVLGSFFLGIVLRAVWFAFRFGWDLAPLP